MTPTDEAHFIALWQQGKPAQKLHQFLSSGPTAERYGLLVRTLWLIVNFGECQLMA
jgi:hypothetical protein